MRPQPMRASGRSQKPNEHKHMLSQNALYSVTSTSDHNCTKRCRRITAAQGCAAETYSVAGARLRHKNKQQCTRSYIQQNMIAHTLKLQESAPRGRVRKCRSTSDVLDKRVFQNRPSGY